MKENMLFNVKISEIAGGSTVNMGSSIHCHPIAKRVWIAVSFPTGDEITYVDGKQNLYIDKDFMDQSG